MIHVKWVFHHLYNTVVFFLSFIFENMFQPPVIPRDSEGYVKSFLIDDLNSIEAKEARAFFEEYGFVVIANVFTSVQCKETISDIWNVIESRVNDKVRNDETLWTPK